MIVKIKQNIRSFTESATMVRRATRYFFVGSGVLFCCYIYFVGAITFSVIQRQGLEESNKSLSSEISMQELRYLSEEKHLTKEVAYSSGLVDAPSLAFTSQKRAFAWNLNAGR